MAIPPDPFRISAQKRYILGLLLAINTINFFDRQILGAVTEPLRREWGLTDFEIGALATAFTLLYAFVGLPLGRMADTRSRTRLLGWGVTAWSLLTALSGAAWNYWSLFLMRLGVGIGEATCAPVSSSLLGDIFPQGYRARAFSIFMLGLPLGSAFSYIISSSVAQQYGWRNAFLVAGLPGLLLGILAFALKEPVRGVLETDAAGSVVQARKTLSAGSPFLKLLGIPTLWWIILSGSLHNFSLYALSIFLPAFLVRTHSMSIAGAGFAVGIVYGAMCGIGMWAGGLVGDFAYRRQSNGRLLVAAISTLLACPLLTLALASPPGQLWLFAAGMIPAALLLYFYYANVYATIQDLVEPALRGTAMAVYFFAMYLLGASLGPIGTGWLSDWLARRAAAAGGFKEVAEAYRAIGLHQAMYLIPILGVLLALVLFAASRTYGSDVERIQRK